MSALTRRGLSYCIDRTCRTLTEAVMRADVEAVERLEARVKELQAAVRAIDQCDAEVERREARRRRRKDEDGDQPV